MKTNHHRNLGWGLSMLYCPVSNTQSPPQKKNKPAQIFLFINTTYYANTTVNFLFQEVLLLAYFDPTSFSLEEIDGDIQDTGNLQNLPENSGIAWVFLAGVGWICAVLFGGASSWACIYSLPLFPSSSLLFRVNEPFCQTWVSLQTTTKISKSTKYFDMMLLLLTCEEVLHAPTLLSKFELKSPPS